METTSINGFSHACGRHGCNKYKIAMDNKLKLGDKVYSFNNKEIYTFEVVSIVTKTNLHGSMVDSYTVECMNCGDYINVGFDDTGKLTPIDDCACRHISNELYTTKKQIRKQVKENSLKTYYQLIDSINTYKARLTSLDDEIKRINDEVVAALPGNKMYGYNHYSYTILEVIEAFNTKILRLKCDSCRHEGEACIVYVFNKCKNKPNVYDFLSADNEEYVYHHFGYTYYTSMEALKLAELKYMYDETKKYMDRKKQNIELIRSFLPLA